jgi:hypothetical protein
MGRDQPIQAPTPGRVVEWFVLAASLLVSFAAGAWFSPWNGQRPASQKSVRIPESPVTATESPAELSPEPLPPVATRDGDDGRPDPGAAEARANGIRRDAAALREECQRAGGDWDAWQRKTAPYRAALRSRIAALKDVPGGPAGNYYEGLAGLDGFPLFEIDSRQYLNYLIDPVTLDWFRRERPVVAADRWLHRRGIDLIFVAIPKMTEVYIDHFVDPSPPDGVIAPHVRRLLLELLENDVEVVDALALFRPVRDLDSEYLYNAMESHWAPRGMRVVARAVADRVARYQFGARARFAPPVVQARGRPYPKKQFDYIVGGMGPQVLTPEQRRRALKAQTSNFVEVCTDDGSPPPDNPASPVLLIGNSYAWGFREQLIRELNLLTRNRVGPGQTTDPFADFLRDPEAIEGCRVLVWIATEQDMTHFRAMPEPVQAALRLER